MNVATFDRPDVISMAKLGWQSVWYTDPQAPVHAVNVFLFEIPEDPKSKPWQDWSKTWNLGVKAKTMAISKAIDFSIVNNYASAFFVELDVQLYKGWYGHVRDCVEHYDMCGMADYGIPPINTGLLPIRASPTMSLFAHDWLSRMERKGGDNQSKMKPLLASWGERVSYKQWQWTEDGFAHSPGMYSHHSINCGDKWKCTKEAAEKRGLHFKALSKDDVCITPRLVLGWPVCTFQPRDARGGCANINMYESASHGNDPMQGSASILPEGIDALRPHLQSDHSLLDLCTRFFL
mmetsp:Transcript_59961/g.170542  ORF Transcript_59961/g.170542 Transcript_59961/m.170542 type:complete len:292 (+) Transcript_59961:263-1138(+)